jgi:EmrB/QacA subfamily drug resistance transporter
MADTQDNRYILTIAVLTSFCNALIISAVIIALPAIGNDLNMNAVQLGWVTQSHSLASAIFILPFGRVADIWGRKKTFTTGLVITIVSTFLATFSISFLMLIPLRVIQGIGMAMMFSTGVALLTSAYPRTDRGRVLGINVAAVYVGLSLGPTIGGLLTQNLGWRSIFLLFVVLQIPALILVLNKVRREWREAKGEKFDITGALLFSIMLFSIIYGFSSLPATMGIVIMLIGVMALVAFIMWELKVKSPLLNVHLLTRNRVLSLSSLAQFIFYSALFSVSFILSLYLQYIKGLSPQDAGFILLSQPVMQAAFSPIAGRISDRIQPRIIVSASVVIALVGLLLLLGATENTSMLLIILGLILVGLSFAFFSPPTMNAIMSSMESKYYGVASAIDSTSRNIGMTFSMSILMLLFSIHMGTAQITPEHYADFVESIRTALIIFSGFCLCCIFVSLARGKVVFTQK